MARFPKNGIMSLIGEPPRFELGESYGPDLRLGDVLDLAGAEGLAELPLSYGTAQGLLGLRKLIADSHGCEAEEVIVTVGGMHALFLIAFTLCDPGDEVVTAAPLFPLARGVLDAVGAKVRVLPLTFDQGYQPDLAHFRRLLTSSTKLVSLATPQNPSGVAFPRETLQAMLDAMGEVCPQAYLLVDETYREAAYGGDPVAESAMAMSPRVIATASLSKCHGAPGLRVGWAVTREAAVREQLLLAKFNTVICGSPLDETLALKILQQGQRITGGRRLLLAEGLDRIARWIGEQDGRVEWVRPNAGALCCLRLSPRFFDEAAVGNFHGALAAEGVRVADGSWFGDEARVFRVGFGFLPPQDLERALAGLSNALKRLALEAA
jgi:aspartate/methionine/tyrosine aminotransferase